MCFTCIYMSEDIHIQEKSKTLTTYEVELFVTLANGCAPLAHGTWGPSKISRRS